MTSEIRDKKYHVGKRPYLIFPIYRNSPMQQGQCIVADLGIDVTLGDNLPLCEVGAPVSKCDIETEKVIVDAAKITANVVNGASRRSMRSSTAADRRTVTSYVSDYLDERELVCGWVQKI
jgi:hypothetical protein